LGIQFHEIPQEYWGPEFHHKYYRKADLVVSVGGDNLTPLYEMHEFFLSRLNYAKYLGNKTVLSAASIGPYTDHPDEEYIIDSLKKIDLISARETITYEYLVGKGLTNVKLVADPAFLLQPVSNEKTKEILNAAGSNPIGVGLSGNISLWGGLDNYYEIFSKYIDHLSDNTKRKILLIPHVMKILRSKAGKIDDYAACKEIYGRIKNKENVIVVPSELFAAELKEVISKCSVFIGARTHSTIASLSSGIPTIAIGYSVKANGIFRDIYGNDDYVIPIKKLSLGSLISLSDALLSHRDELIKIITSSMPSIRERAMSNGTLMASLV
jgi:polysaccharide pyruvyl transferase WcaK-like protein